MNQSEKLKGGRRIFVYLITGGLLFGAILTGILLYVLLS
jgi:hypothetical protein